MITHDTYKLHTSLLCISDASLRRLITRAVDSRGGQLPPPGILRSAKIIDLHMPNEMAGLSDARAEKSTTFFLGKILSSTAPSGKQEHLSSLFCSKLVPQQVGSCHTEDIEITVDLFFCKMFSCYFATPANLSYLRP